MTRTRPCTHIHTLSKIKDPATKQRYEWMTHKAPLWSHLTSFLWLDGNKCCGKKREISVLLHYGLKQGASVLPAQSGAVGGICIHVVGPWENVSLECIVSHIGSHLENHLLTSPPPPPRLLLPVPSTCSSRPPSHQKRMHARANVFIHRPHSSRARDDSTHKPAVLVKSALSPPPKTKNEPGFSTSIRIK